MKTIELERDLSKYGNLISGIFKQPKSAKEWDQYKLSKDQIAHFNEYGYVSDVKILEEWQADQLNDELVEIMDVNHANHDLLYEFHTNESSAPDKIVFHSLGHWRMTSGFHDILWNPAFVMAAYQLLGEKAVRFWHDQLFCKPAKHGGVVAWHQDYSYWTRSTPMQHLTGWVALDDATKENGCLQYIPKSQKWGLLDKPLLTGEMRGLTEFLSTEQIVALDKPVAIEVKKGYGTFHHPLLVHGSFENKSEKPRRAFVINVFADGTKSNSDEVILTSVPTIKKGEKMDGQFFPLLYPLND